MSSFLVKAWDLWHTKRIDTLFFFKSGQGLYVKVGMQRTDGAVARRNKQIRADNKNKEQTVTLFHNNILFLSLLLYAFSCATFLRRPIVDRTVMALAVERV